MKTAGILRRQSNETFPKDESPIAKTNGKIDHETDPQQHDPAADYTR